MQITFLGHAGFLVETAGALVVADPWLSATGAFDSAWMQLPQNHHLADALRARLEETDKACFLYVSHEHRDHFDPDLLATLPIGKITAVIPRFRRAALRLVRAERITALYLIPTLFYDLVHAPDCSRDAVESVTKLGYAGAPMLAALTEACVKTFQPRMSVPAACCR
jgi:acyl-CoA synthetase (AMP-forming)/AMP-acid ligase II